MNNNMRMEDYSETYFYSLWSWTHLLCGFMFFIIMCKYFKLSSLHICIILLIFHTIYEYKDYYITYNVYDNNIKKINNGRRMLREKQLKEKIFPGSKPEGEFHMPPQSFANSIGDTLFFMAGLLIAHFVKDKIGQKVSKIILAISIIYWIDILISYIYVIDLGLHDKKYVEKNL